jgi:hypothetical protein
MPNRFAEYVSCQIKKPYEIEHIWADKYEQRRDEFASSEEFARVRNFIGGLVLIPRGFNQSYGAYLIKISLQLLLFKNHAFHQ